MKVHISVVNDQGAKFEGSAELVRILKSARASKPVAKAHTASHSATKISFSLNSRAFMNKYAKTMSGSRKFTLLLAHLAQGKIGKLVAGEQITSTWNRMKSVLGGAYNAAHATRAKAEGWIDSPKWAHYALAESWKEVIGNE
ncbi:MAG: hypothetical protein WDZ66_00830 [Steroidobacteraceae bacterium]